MGACLLAGTAAAAVSRTAAHAANPFAAASPQAVVLFVPLDTHARALLHGVVPALRKWLPPEQQLAVAPTDPHWANPARHGELNGDAVERDLLARFQQAHGSRTVLLMAVSSRALYAPAIPQYAFVFGSWVHGPGLQYSAAFGTLPMRVYQPERERSRLTKMMLRYIGEIVCNPYLRRNANPRSVMFDPLLGTADLDRMVATLPARCRRR